MHIGIPKERLPYEYRIGLPPTGVQMLVQNGHTCSIEHDAGIGTGFSDTEYEQAGGKIVYSPKDIFSKADLVIKIARPLLEEIEWLRPGAALAGVLHLGLARKDIIEALLKNHITTISFEQITLSDGHEPVRRSLSQIGGRLAAQIGARLLQTNAGGKGILIGGVVGVPPAEVVIIGAGVVGTCATKSFIGMGAHVTVLDTDLLALQNITERCQGITTVIANPVNIARSVAYADIVVGAILVRGEHPPIVVPREMVQSMKPRSVIIDMSIDEGGCFETSRPTTHDQPTYIEEGIIHYCVPNMPSVVARSATYALLNSAFPYILEMANNGVDTAIQNDPALEKSLATYRGELKTVSGRSMPPFAVHVAGLS